MLYEPFGPWIVPWRFSAFEEEYSALRNTAGIVDFSTQALLELRGPDRAGFLHRLLTNDILHLAPGAGCRAALLDASAKLIISLVVLADPDSLWLMCDLPLVDTLAKAIERYLFSEQVTLINHERRLAVLAVDGPRAQEVARTLTGAEISFPQPLSHAVVPVHALPVRWLRHSLTGSEGLMALVNAEDALGLWDQLQRVGQPLGATPIGWEALNVARIEAGRPWFGIDMDETNLLPETGLETSMVSDTKGCYIGQEIIARMQTYGSPNKRLVGLLIDGELVPQPGDRVVRADTEEIGWVTSGCHSPALRRPIAMGYVKRGAYEPGTTVEILRGETAVTATVVALPIMLSVMPRHPSQGLES